MNVKIPVGVFIDGKFIKDVHGWPATFPLIGLIYTIPDSDRVSADNSYPLSVDGHAIIDIHKWAHIL